MSASDAEGAALQDSTEQQRDAMRRTAEARVKTGNFIARLMMAYAGFAAFCVFTLLSPDRLMIDAQASLDMPFAGTVPFLAFMLVAPALLIGMRFYLEVYYQHWRQLDAQLEPETEPKTLSPLKHPLLRIFSALVLYMLLPAMLGLFAWKAAAKDVWGEVFLVLTVVCTAAQVNQFVRRHWSRRTARITVVSGSVFVFVLVGVLYEWGLPHRGLELSREDLTAAYLVGEDLRDAVLNQVNLTDAALGRADLTGASLTDANLTGAALALANLSGADLAGADLTSANLSGANLTDAILIGTDLSGADLLGTYNLTQKQLQSACINTSGKPPFLPEDLNRPRNVCILRTR